MANSLKFLVIVRLSDNIICQLKMMPLEFLYLAFCLFLDGHNMYTCSFSMLHVTCS